MALFCVSSHCVKCDAVQNMMDMVSFATTADMFLIIYKFY
jgi:hypothetical protein